MSLFSSLKAYIAQIFGSSTTATRAVNSPAAPVSDIPNCRYRLDNNSSDTVILPDGRKLGYAQYGLLTRRPIFLLHGHPGSRIEGAWLDEFGLKLGARIICMERPGFGWSSPNPNRTILDVPKELEYLANHLEIDDYRILGVSGGGPYALACAVALPREKLKCISIVCGLGPHDIGMKGAGWSTWIGFTFGYRYLHILGLNWLGRWYISSDPQARLDLPEEKRVELLVQGFSKSKMCEKDLEIWKDKDLIRLFVRTAGEVYSQGFDPQLLDGLLLSTDFGFRVEDIRPDLPVQLWYGKNDTNVPLNHGKQIAARLGDRAHLRIEDDTHLGIYFWWREEILKVLLQDT